MDCLQFLFVCLISLRRNLRSCLPALITTLHHRVYHDACNNIRIQTSQDRGRELSNYRCIYDWYRFKQLISSIFVAKKKHYLPTNQGLSLTSSMDSCCVITFNYLRRKSASSASYLCVDYNGILRCCCTGIANLGNCFYCSANF